MSTPKILTSLRDRMRTSCHQINIRKIDLLFSIITLTILIAILIVYYMLESDRIEELSLNKWDSFAFIIALISLVLSGFTTYSQRMTEKNTMRITPESQKQLLYDYARHFYMNLIVIKAIRAKVAGRYHEFYPAEEHLLKLKADLGALHPAIFFNNIKHYNAINELQVMLRNFNEEIDVMVKHMTDKDLYPAAKDRDFDTLEFKMAFLTEKVLNTLNIMWGDYNSLQHTRMMRDIITAKLKKRNSADNLEKAEKYFSKENNRQLILKAFQPKMITALYPDYDDRQLTEALHEINRHIYVEMTCRNDSGSEKIFLIPFDPNYTPDNN